MSTIIIIDPKQVELLFEEFNKESRHLFHKLEKKMSDLSDRIASLTAKVTDLEAADAALGTALVAEIGRAEAKIAELQALIEAGSATPEDIAALAAIEDRVAALKASLDTQTASADAELPPPPPPPAEPGA